MIAEQISSTDRAQDPCAGPRLLVVEDESLVRVTLARGLHRLGYAVTEAESGEQAIEIGMSEPFDLAIFDVRLGGMGGIDAACKLRQDRNLPFIVLSAWGEQSLVEQAVQCGALGYLVKPLDTHQIAPTVEAALGRAREIRALRESEAGLNTALAQTRDISIAVGIAMERLGMDRQHAFEHLRSRTRSQRRKLADLAHQIVTGKEEP